MKIFKVTGKALSLAANSLVRLTVAQAAVRSHLLEPIEGPGCDERSTYKALDQLHFKAGEVVWSDADVNKALLQDIEIIDELTEHWDPTAKVDKIKNFAVMLPGFKLDPSLKLKGDIVEAIEKHLAGQDADKTPGDEWDPENMDVQQMHEFAFKNTLDIDLNLSDHAELQTAIETAQLTTADQE